MDQGRSYKRKDCQRFRRRRFKKTKQQAPALQSLQEAVVVVYLNAARTKAHPAGLEAIAHLIHECCDLAKSPDACEGVCT